MACPICISPEGTAMTAGMRAGALVLIIAVSIIGALIARFAWRLRRAEMNSSAAENIEQAARGAEG